MVHLSKSIPIKKISVGFYQNIDFWIWQPTSVEYAVSNDGKEFKKVAAILNEIPQNKDGNIIQNISHELNNVTTRFVRVRAKNIGACP